jgi:hypothetical protein
MKAAERELEITRARARADLARMRFGNAVNTTLHRLSPDRIKDDVIDAASETLQDAKRDLLKRLRYWPYVIVPMLATLALLFFWRPARALVRHAIQAGSLIWTYRNLWSLWK